MQSKLTAYLESQRRDSNWSALLNPFLYEVFATLGEEQARHLLVNAGIRAGQDLALPACESIAQLELEANLHWSRLGWGLVTFIEHSDYLEITHECIPAQAPEYGSLADFLQGVYQQWFRAAGAGDLLKVHQTNEAHTGVFSFRLVG